MSILAEPRIKSVSPDEIVGEVASGEALVIDVRRPEDWRVSRIPGAINIPHGVPGSKASRDTPFFDPRIRPDRPLCINCATGNRSALVTAILNDMGYEKAINLKGGFEAWEAAGYPVAGGENEEPGSTEAKIHCGPGNDVVHTDPPSVPGGLSPDTFPDGSCETIDDTVN